MQYCGPYQRRQNDQEGEGQKRESTDENISDGFKPQKPPGPGIPDVIGAIKPDPDRFDTTRRKIDGENNANREHPAPRLHQDIVNLIRNRRGDLLWPGLK